MQHDRIAHIQADVGHAGGVISSDKKHKVAGLGLRTGNRGADVVQALRSQPSHVPAGMIDDPRDKSAAIKTGAVIYPPAPITI